MNFTTLTMTLIGVGAGVMVGVLLTTWQMRRVTRVGLRIPSKWPLVSRALVKTPKLKSGTGCAAPFTTTS